MNFTKTWNLKKQMNGMENKTMKEFDFGYGSAKAEIEEFGMDDDMRDVFEIYTEDPENFLGIVPATAVGAPRQPMLKGKYPVCEFTKGYMQYCKEYINENE
jgi:hypothetical protein